MRKIILMGILILLGSGCLEGKLSPGEAQLCLLSTAAQPSLIPECKTPQECEDELNKSHPNQIFTQIPVGSDIIRARKGASGVWSSVRAASKSIEQIHRSCAALSIADILPGAVVSASELQNALRASEEAQEYTYRAIQKAVVHGAELELEYVKDTKAFEEYAELVQMVHGLETQNPASDWSRMQQSNREFFENIGKQISNNKAGKYNVEWNTVFGTYRTGVEIAVPERARVLLAVSPLWQGALSAFLGKSKSSNTLTLVSTIHANDVIVRLEQVAAPQNGIIFYAWRKLNELDLGVAELVNAEEESNSQGAVALAELEGKAVRIKNDGEKWKNIGKIDNENETIGRQSTGEYDFLETVREWKNEYTALNEARTSNSVSLGKRTADWRKWQKKGEDIREKMNEVEMFFDELGAECGTLEDAAGENKNTSKIGADDCARILDERILLENDANQKITNMNEGRLQACVKKLNKVEEALEIAATTTEWFEEYFGRGKSDACEAALMNRKTAYDNQPLVREWNKLKEKMQQYERALGNASHTMDWPEKKSGLEKRKMIHALFANEKEFMREEELQKKIREGEAIQDDVENEIRHMITSAFATAKWRIIHPEKIHAGMEESAEIEGRVRAHWNEELDVRNLIILSNPGMEEIEQTSEGWNGVADGGVLIFESENVGRDDIIIRGKGKEAWVRMTNPEWRVNILGNNALVNEIYTLETAFFPVQAGGEWSPPEIGQTTTPLVYVNEKITNSQNGRWDASLKNNTTTLRFSYSVNEVIRVDTTVEDQQSNWGRAYTRYRVNAQNGLNEEIVANISTGVSGAGANSIFISNENGEKIGEMMDAAGGVVLIKQSIPAHGTRSYWVQIERDEGIEEWASVAEYLTLELEALEKSSFREISVAAGKLKTKIYALKNEKNSVALAQKVSEIQTEVSGLLAKKELVEEEFARLESEWRYAVQRADENSLWLHPGEIARQKMDFPKWREALVKLSEEITGKIVQEEKTQTIKSEWLNENTELLNKANNTVGEYEKAISIGCEKLSEVGFICPIMEDTLKNYKKILTNHGKTISTMEKKLAKMNEEKQIVEWKNNEVAWKEMNKELSRIQSEMESALRNVRNAGVERVAELKRETNNNGNEDVLSAVEKANDAIEKGEFGKGLFVAQSVLWYVSGNKTTGLVSLPPVAWPIVGVICLVSIWMGWKEWKKKNRIVIQKQVIPRALTTPQTDLKIAASEHQAKLGEPQREHSAKEERYTRARTRALLQKKEEN